MEIWDDIKDFEGKYQISTKGHVKSLNYNNTRKEKILIPKIKKNNGLLEVTLSKNDNKHYFMLNRLVIQTFTDYKLEKNDVVMYKDGDKTNCALENLYIITRGKRQELTYDLDHRYRPKYEYYGEILATKEISKITGIKAKRIRDRVKRSYWSIYEAAEIPVAIQNKKG